MQHLTRARTSFSTTRPLHSLSLFLAVAVGFVLTGRNWIDALIDASPMLAISLAGFCVNDIFDQETDRINHPDRPLATFPALSKSVVALYVVLFTISIGLIFVQDSPKDKFTWAITFILLSNYNFFKRNFPLLKNAYIAATACVVASIFDVSSHYVPPFFLRYEPLFCAVFARELMLDIPDVRGDKGTLALKLTPKRSSHLAIMLYFIALSSMLFLSRSSTQFAASIIGIVSFFFYAFAKLVLEWKENTLRPLSGLISILPVVMVIT